jgi:hypothetical protein
MATLKAPVWEEPPAPARGPSALKRRRMLEQLQARPGQWALVEQGPGNNEKAWRRLGCEVARRTRAGVSKVWARWPGEVAEEHAVEAAPQEAVPAVKPGFVRVPVAQPEPVDETMCEHCGRTFATAHGVEIHRRRTGCGRTPAVEAVQPAAPPTDGRYIPGPAYGCRSCDFVGSKDELVAHASERHGRQLLWDERQRLTDHERRKRGVVPARQEAS